MANHGEGSAAGSVPHLRLFAGGTPSASDWNGYMRSRGIMAAGSLRDRLSPPAGIFQQLAGLDLKSIGDAPQHGHAGGYVAALDAADITHTQARAVCEFFLRQLLFMTYPTQIPRHDLFEIHEQRGTSIGTIILGTIVPIRVRSCYSFDRSIASLCLRNRTGTERLHESSAPT